MSHYLLSWYGMVPRNLVSQSASQPPREAVAVLNREEETGNTQGGSGCGWRRVEGKINEFIFGYGGIWGLWRKSKWSCPARRKCSWEARLCWRSRFECSQLEGSKWGIWNWIWKANADTTLGTCESCRLVTPWRVFQVVRVGPTWWSTETAAYLQFNF